MHQDRNTDFGRNTDRVGHSATLDQMLADGVELKFYPVTMMELL